MSPLSSQLSSPNLILSSVGMGMISLILWFAACYWLVVVGKRAAKMGAGHEDAGLENTSIREILGYIFVITYGIVVCMWFFLAIATFSVSFRGSLPKHLVPLAHCKIPKQVVRDGDSLALTPSNPVRLTVSAGTIKSLRGKWKLNGVEVFFNAQNCKASVSQAKDYSAMGVMGVGDGDYNDQPADVEFDVSFPLDLSKKPLYQFFPTKVTAILKFPTYAGYGTKLHNYGHRFDEHTETRRLQLQAVVVSPEDLAMLDHWNSAATLGSFFCGTLIITVGTVFLGWLAYYLTRPLPLSEDDVVWRADV